MRDLNRLYRDLGRAASCRRAAAGFEWIDADDAERSVYAWLRRSDDADDAPVIVVCNFTPVPRHDHLLGVPEGTTAWCELINTDDRVYGGSGLASIGERTVPVLEVAAHGRKASIRITLPPLATVYLVPATPA